MTLFRVRLKGREEEGRPRPPSGPPGLARRLVRSWRRWRLQSLLRGYSAQPRWFAAEPVAVHLSRRVRALPSGPGWELNLVQPPPTGWFARLGVAALAVASTLASLTAPVQAHPSRAAGNGRTLLPEAAEPTAPGIVPTAHPPEVVLQGFTLGRTAGSFDLSSFDPLLDSQGKPVLLAAFHENFPASHTNVPSGQHQNVPWSNHVNVPGGHTDAPWSNHANVPASVHTNMMPGDLLF